MEPPNEEMDAYEDGSREMWKKIDAGDLPSEAFIGKQLARLFSLANKTERVQGMRRAANLKINATVSHERSRAKIPAYRFAGQIGAILAYARACRQKGVVRVE